MGKIIETADLGYAYPGGFELKDINISISGGEIVSVLGQNGSGKSTLLRSVCGLLRYGGSCLMGGRETRDMTPYEKNGRMSYLSSDSTVSLETSALDAVTMGLSDNTGLFARQDPENEKKALSAMERLGIEDLAERNLRDLSRGQRQLVLIARTLARDSRLYVLDEPGGALDITRRKLLMEVLREKVSSGKSAVLMSSHNTNLMAQYADRCVFIRDGNIINDVKIPDADPETVSNAVKEAFPGAETAVADGRLIVF